MRKNSRKLVSIIKTRWTNKGREREEKGRKRRDKRGKGRKKQRKEKEGKGRKGVLNSSFPNYPRPAAVNEKRPSSN